MTRNLKRWVVLAGELSPYTLDLWDKVAETPGHSVVLFHVPRLPRQDYAHEDEVLRSERVCLRQVHGLQSALEAVAQARRAPPHILVCMGYTPSYKTLAAAVVQALHRQTVVAYMSDANGLDLLRHPRSGGLRLWALVARRLLLRSIFDVSLDLGSSNAVAHELLGIRAHVQLPLLAVMPPQDPRVLPLPSAVQDRIAALERPRLGCAARLAPCKNLVALTCAWARHVADGGRGSLAIAGAGPLWAELEAAAAGLAPNRFALLGAVPYRRARQLFLALDGSVLVSTREPWGIAVVESLLAGTPALASTCVGSAWSLATLAPGAIVLTETSEEAVAGSLQQFVDNLPAHREAALGARPKIHRWFAIDEVRRRLVAFAAAARPGSDWQSISAALAREP
jgi:glycosyltransferase involved in cell wall biosynthesis